MSASIESTTLADVGSLRAAVALSPIVVHPDVFERPITNWAAIRNSTDVDAFILAWIASHGRGVRGHAQ
jgi:hypothetical protein